jgi:uncharacterized membrane protein
MSTDPLALPATTHRLRRLARAGALSEPALARAHDLLHETPGATEWRTFLGRALALLGAGLLLAGAVCAVAYNWARVGRFGKFALIEAAIVAAAVVGWRALPRLSGQLAVLAASVLVGPLLAVYGQAYQTGADPYGLFLTWCAVIVPWAVAARLSALWLLLVVLLDVGLALFWRDVVAPTSTGGAIVLPLLVAALHAVAIAGWEWQRGRAEPWLHGAWAPHALAAAGYLALLVAAGSAVVGEWQAGAAGAAGVAALAAAIAASFHYHRRVRRDRLMLTLGGAAALVWTALVAGRLIFGVLALRVSGLFIMALVVLAELALGLRWFRGTRRPPDPRPAA